MKKVFSILAAALMTVAMVSCEKEKENDILADNTLVYDGTTYKLESRFSYPNHSMGWVDIHSVETNSAGEYLIRVPEDLNDIHVYADVVGKEIDLTAAYNEWPGYMFAVEGAVNVLFSASDEGSWGEIEGERYNTTPFKSGKMKISVENGNFIWVIDGQTKNNHTLKVRIVAPDEGWQPTIQ